MLWLPFGVVKFTVMQSPKILITRTSPELDLEPLLSVASRLFKDSVIDVLKGSHEPNLRSEAGRVNAYLHYEGTSWSKKAMSASLKGKIKSSGYDILIFGVGSEWRDRALSLKLFTWQTGIGSIILMDEHGETKAYDRIPWLFRSLYVETVWRVGYRILVEQDEKLTLAKLKLVPLQRKLSKPNRSGKKRVAVVTYSLGVGGVQKQIVELARGLNPHDYELRVYLLIKEDAFFEPALRALNIGVEYLYEKPQPMLLYRTMAKLLAEKLSSFNPHVIHSYMNYPSVVACLVAARLRPEVLITSVRTLTGQGASFYTWNGENCRQLDRGMVDAADVVIGNSHAVLKDYAQWTGCSQDKMQVVYNGIDKALYEAVTAKEVQALRKELGLKKATPVVLVVGRLSPEKEQATFCRSIERVQKTVPTVCGALVGEGPSKPILRTDFKNLEDTGTLVFAGNRKDVPVWMHMADVVVLTSAVEGLPNVLIEAALTATPVVTTACGGGEEVVEDGVTGFVVPVGDDAMAAEKITELLENPKTAKTMGKAAKHRALTLFSPQKMVEDTTAFYGEL
ncbi:MAG: glycosyltransferase [Deltaproteobacteria bacterium]|jgi:L-malate glycosyltransferase|nr:glycosyltransferase [Deltaproteobacteria bacterium]MBT6489760.1 glycosyltransferase [Deltaproteobacteria bacterium]